MQREGRVTWPDDRLVAACLKGDQQAWSALIDKYKNLIFSIPMKLGLYDDAADIFQAVCLDLLNDLPRLRESRALPKWLMQTRSEERRVGKECGSRWWRCRAEKTQRQD